MLDLIWVSTALPWRKFSTFSWRKQCTTRERSDKPKVPRGVREHILNVRKTCHAPRTMNIEKNINGKSHRRVLFCQGLSEVLRPPRKKEPKASEVLRLPHGIIILSWIQFRDSFAQSDFRTVQNLVQGHQIITAPPPTPHLSFWTAHLESATHATKNGHTL